MLTDSPLAEKISSTIAAAAVGPDGYLTPPHLIRLFQEAAMRNTLRLELSSPELIARHNLTWVMRRQYLRARRWPQLNEAVTVVTAPTSLQRKLITTRDFYLLDTAGQVLVSATSEWLVIDLDRRRLRPLPPEVLALEGRFPTAQATLTVPPEAPSPPPAAPPPKTRHFRVPYYQLDFNNHLTNPAFPELMLEPLGREFLAANSLVSLDITFEREARYGDELMARALGDGTEFYHDLGRVDKVLARMRTTYRSRVVKK